MELGSCFLIKWLLVMTLAHFSSSQNYDRDRQDDYNRRQDDYNRNQNNQDQYNRNRDTTYNSDGTYSRTYEPYNRNNNSDPYNNRNQYGHDQYNRSGQDQYNRNNSDPYNRNQYNPNDPYNRNNNQSNYNRNDPYDPYRRNTDQYNRNNDPNNRNNDPYNRNNDPYNRNTNDPNNRNNDPYGHNPNDPYNRNNDNNNRSNDPNNRHNDPYNRNNDPYLNRNDNRFGGNTGGGSRYGADDGNCCEDYCYKVDEQPYVQYGSKTPYQFAYGKISNQHIVPQCKPIQFWSLVREGTSLPDRMSVDRYKQLQKIHDDIIRNYEETRTFPDRGRLCSEDFDMLKRWRWNESVSDFNAGSLTQQGSDDLKFLARRYQTRLRDLLVPYNENQYFFQYTDGDNSHETYKAYVEGLFGNDAARVHASVRSDASAYSRNENSYSQNSQYNSQQSANSPYGQSLYAQNENSYSSHSQSYSQQSQQQSQYGRTSSSRCKTFEQQMDENRNTAREYQNFKQKQEYKELVKNVFRRLGFRYALNDTIIEDMYDVCRYEKSWYVTRQSPWCAAFTPSQLKLLEYGDDLFYYYRSGYAHEMINRNIGCGLVKDMYERFERTINNGRNNEQKGIVHFRDLDTMLRTLVTLGIGKDQNTLTADNYFQLTRREWRLSELAPFSGNLAAILYQCDNQADPYKVMFFLNEKPVEFPSCSVGLCSWQTMKEKYERISQECRLDWCERGGAALNSASAIFTLICAAFTYLYQF